MTKCKLDQVLGSIQFFGLLVLLYFRFFGYFFGHLVFYLFGPLDPVYCTSSFIFTAWSAKYVYSLYVIIIALWLSLNLNQISLHWNISLSFCSFSYSGICWDVLNLSVSDIIAIQKSSNGDRKLQFFGPDYNFFLLSLCKDKSLGKDTLT